MSDHITITVHGRPAPQGSKRAFAIRKGGVLTGKVAVIESSHDRVKSWRQAVVDEARSALGWGERPPLNGPLDVSMIFYMPRPKGHYRTGKNAHQLRDSAPTCPATAPDLSKLCRSTEDALTDSGIWADDALVVNYCRLAKVYVREDHYPGELMTPGAVITIRQVTS